MEIELLTKTEKTEIELYNFFKSNEYLLPDPFSQYVDLKEYVGKLLSMGSCFVAKENNEIVGICCGYINNDETKEAFLQILLVEEKKQGAHIGTDLINAFISHAIKVFGKTAVVYLTVDDCNERAKKLYTRIGFTISRKGSPKTNKTIMEYSVKNNEVFLSTREVQSRLLVMAKAIAQILEENSIPYMLAFGTLLGAVRHKGFIPWDDDFDFFLFEDSYDEALNLLRAKLPGNMFVEDDNSEPLYFHGWAHIKDLETETDCKQYPQDSIYKHKGISIDLYKAKKIKSCELDDYIADEHVNYIKRKQKLGLISNNDAIKKINEITENKYSFGTEKTDDYVFAINLAERRMELEDVLPLKKYDFEDTQFYGCNNFHNLLNWFYGEDYMELPPMEKRLPHYSYVRKIKF